MIRTTFSINTYLSFLARIGVFVALANVAGGVAILAGRITCTALDTPTLTYFSFLITSFGGLANDAATYYVCKGKIRKIAF